MSYSNLRSHHHPKAPEQSKAALRQLHPWLQVCHLLLLRWKLTHCHLHQLCRKTRRRLTESVQCHLRLLHWKTAQCRLLRLQWMTVLHCSPKVRPSVLHLRI